MKSLQKSVMLSSFRMSAASVAIFVAAVVAVASPGAQSQTFTVLHNFTGGQDGASPLDGLTFDAAGNLYGTTAYGGHNGYGCVGTFPGCGVVFKLARSGTGWILRPLYEFQSSSDGGNPATGVTIGPDGALYGTSGTAGNCNGNDNACGVIFRLRPPSTSCGSFECPWQKTQLHAFTGSPDGSYPSSRVIFDPAGNFYGATVFGGVSNTGSIYEMIPGQGGWSENGIYSFPGALAPGPGGPMVLDQTGNIYGSAGFFYGTVWQLQPSQFGWSENTLFSFNGTNGMQPTGLVRDSWGTSTAIQTEGLAAIVRPPSNSALPLAAGPTS